MTRDAGRPRIVVRSTSDAWRAIDVELPLTTTVPRKKASSTVAPYAALKDSDVHATFVGGGDDDDEEQSDVVVAYDRRVFWLRFDRANGDVRRFGQHTVEAYVRQLLPLSGGNVRRVGVLCATGAYVVVGLTPSSVAEGKRRRALVGARSAANEACGDDEVHRLAESMRRGLNVRAAE